MKWKIILALSSMSEEPRQSNDGKKVGEAGQIKHRWPWPPLNRTSVSTSKNGFEKVEKGVDLSGLTKLFQPFTAMLVWSASVFLEFHQFLEAARRAGAIITALGAELQSLPGPLSIFFFFFLITSHFHDSCGKITQWFITTLLGASVHSPDVSALRRCAGAGQRRAPVANAANISTGILSGFVGATGADHLSP